MHDCDVSAAVAAGLACRPIEETVADTWAWMQSQRQGNVARSSLASLAAG